MNDHTYCPKRSETEWYAAIRKIIDANKGIANYKQLYQNIPGILILNARELKLSGEEKEAKWRGTLRGYLSHLTSDGILEKTRDDTGRVAFRTAI